MTIEMNRTRFRLLFVGLTVSVGLGVVASCLSGEQAPGAKRVGYPGESSPEAPPPLSSPAPFRASAAQPKVPSSSRMPSLASAAETPVPEQVDRQPSISEEFEKRRGIKLSPLDKAAMDDCPERAWSKNVPQRRCTNDDECGDGFCDRNHCAPLWSCRQEYSRRCEQDADCARRPCIDGRCRSCISDAECARVNIQDGECTPDPSIPGARECTGVVGSVDGDVAPRPPPQRPKL